MEIDFSPAINSGINEVNKEQEITKLFNNCTERIHSPKANRINDNVANYFIDDIDTEANINDIDNLPDWMK